MDDLIEIAGTIIAPGENRKVDINIDVLPDHTEVNLPVFVYRSRTVGPSLLLTAGLHGDEVNGTEIIRRLIRTKEIFPEAGTIIAVPLVNIYGFLHGTRYFPDGKDLNRSFPGSKWGSLAARIAHTLMSDIIPHIDFGVDFHTGGDARTNYPQTRCILHVPENRRLAEAFSAPFILDSPFIDKSFRKEAFRAGKYIIVYEGGESRRFDEFSIREGMRGVKRLMKYLGMGHFRGEDLGAEPSIILPKSTWVRARTAGLFTGLCEYGAYVRKGSPIGVITDPYGNFEHRIVSPHDGYLIGLNYTPVVNGGDALIHIGIPAHDTASQIVGSMKGGF